MNPLVILTLCFFAYQSAAEWNSGMVSTDLPGSDTLIQMKTETLQEVESSASTCQYRIQIQTGCVKDGGTDANVRVSFYSRYNQGITFDNLDNADQDDFEQCHTDTFFRSNSCLNDRICHMVLSHDNSGKKGGWFVSTVTVTEQSTGTTSFFNVNRWLARDERPYSTSADVNVC